MSLSAPLPPPGILKRAAAYVREIGRGRTSPAVGGHGTLELTGIAGASSTSLTRKSIAVVVPELLPVPPVLGGAIESWVHEMTALMDKAARRLTVVSRPAGTPGLAHVEYVGVPWTRTERLFSRIKDAVGRRNPLRYVAKIQNVWSYSRRAARAVRESDIVYVHNEPNLVLFLRRRKGQRIVLHMHNDHLSMRVFRRPYRRALAKVDTVLCVSEYIRKRAIEAFPQHADKFKVVLNGTDPEVFRPYGDEAWQRLANVVPLERSCKYVLYVGRLTSIKGVHILIQAFPQVLAQWPDARLIIAGSSFFAGAAITDYERWLSELAAPIGRAIVFTGYLPHEYLKYLYSVPELVVVPSVWPEPSGLVVLEGMAAGSCVIGTNVGGIPEIIDHQRTGVLVPSGDPATLAATICELLADPARRTTIGAAARAKIAERHEWRRLVAELDAVIGADR